MGANSSKKGGESLQERVVLVTTNCDEVEGYPDKTGNWLEELAAPYFAFSEAGYDVVVASTKGGHIPIDEKSKSDDFAFEASKRFLAEKASVLEETVALASLTATGVRCVFLVGGHGVYGDFANNARLQALVQRVAQQGGVIASVCHGQVGLVGLPLIKDKRLTSFTNAEEDKMGLKDKVPFLLQDKLAESGAKFEEKEPFSVHVVADGRLVTGQNNFSPTAVADKAIEILKATDRVLLLVTSESEVPGYFRPTGSWLEEVAAPYYVFANAGMDVQIVSTRGGTAPIDPNSRQPDFYWDAGKRFDADHAALGKLNSTVPASHALALLDETVKAVFVVGGHGGYADMEEFAPLLRKAAELGAYVCAVCHGPLAFKWTPELVKGKKATGFTNEEETQVAAAELVPFLIQDELTSLGATFSCGAAWTEGVVEDGKLVTGQNNFSAGAVANKVLEKLKQEREAEQ